MVFLVQRFVLIQHVQIFFFEAWHIPSSAATKNLFPCNILNEIGEKFVIFWTRCDIVDLVFEVGCKTDPVCFLEIETALVGTIVGVTAAWALTLIRRCCVLGIKSRTPFLHKRPIVCFANVMSGLYPVFHLTLIKKGGCLAACTRESRLLSKHCSTALPSSFVKLYPHWILWLLILK